MTVSELRELLKDKPDDMPVVRIEPVLAGFWVSPVVRIERMYKHPAGGYCQFKVESLRHRNDTEVLVIE